MFVLLLFFILFILFITFVSFIVSPPSSLRPPSRPERRSLLVLVYFVVFSRSLLVLVNVLYNLIVYSLVLPRSAAGRQAERAGLRLRLPPKRAARRHC